MMSQIEKEFDEYDKNQMWPMVYQKIKNEASMKSITDQHTVGEARKAENRSKNRYRDVSPYDHSRVALVAGESDYINASLTTVPESNRRYILTQGPLEHTAGQFWQMIWEQETKAIIMLNRIIEKGTLKCHQYWPLEEDEDDEEMIFEDAAFKVTLQEEQAFNHFIVRTVDLENLQTNETREVLHFHYVTWPDFGVPTSPVSFLNFLEAVREQGVLENDAGPAVIHCSAGIGRSGTFCLVDSALILVEKTGTLCGIDLKSLLLTMRTCRMGLIQTPEQLRFSYLAIIEGAKKLLTGESNTDVNEVLENYMDMSGGQAQDDTPPPPPQRTSSLSPSKGRPPPPPPRRVCMTNPGDDDKDDVTENKRTKRDENETDIPQTTPRLVSPEKPPRTPLMENQTDNIDAETETKKSDPSVTESESQLKNTFINNENNNPVLGKAGGVSIGEGVAQGEGLGDEGVAMGGDHQMTGNSTTGGTSETELRHRLRNERKKKTQEIIEDMKKKQRKSETWKKRKTYYKPIAIGLSLLLGSLLLYKLYWS